MNPDARQATMALKDKVHIFASETLKIQNPEDNKKQQPKEPELEEPKLGFFSSFLQKTFGTTLRKQPEALLDQVIPTASSPIEEEHHHM